MIALAYTCRKTVGRPGHADYAPNWDKLPDASKQYLAQKGFNEYMDNYHASVTVKEHGEAKCGELVVPMLVEAFARLMAGDVPGNKANIYAALAAENKAATERAIAAEEANKKLQEELAELRAKANKKAA